MAASHTKVAFKNCHWSQWEHERSKEEAKHAAEVVVLLKGLSLEEIAAHCSGVLQRYSAKATSSSHKTAKPLLQAYTTSEK